MKLVRYGPRGQERYGVLDVQGGVRDITSEYGSEDRTAGAGASILEPRSLDRLRALDVDSLPLVEGEIRLGPCVAGVGKLIGVGLNYRQHAIESGMAAPTEPVLFTKAITSISGPFDDVVIPASSQKTDWEVELAVVIGQPCKNLPESKALDHVAGYAIMNDVSERAYQLEGTGQWLKGKSLDTFAPFGPWLVTTDEIPDPQNLRLWLSVNDEVMQDSNTSDMLFPVSHLVSYISRYMTLLPGDVIATGTPEGVGMGKEPQRYLREGDVMVLGVEGLGEQRQRVVRAS